MTQVIDPADPVLGFTIRLIRALDERTDAMVVVANEVRAVPADLDVEILSLGKELGHGRLAKGARYQRILADVGRRLRPATLLAHMCPTYLTLAAPVVRATGGRSMLWFTHLNESAGLRRAERLADVILTALPGSYPRTNDKVRAIGHSIDTDQFRVGPRAPRSGSFELLALGRTSPNKNYPVVIRAVQRAREMGADVHLRIVGPSTTAAERAHRAELDELVVSLDLANAVTIASDVAHDQVPDALTAADALVNATSSGSADKVVFEALACGRPALVSSAAFTDLVAADGCRLSFREGDVDDLADAICRLAALPTTGRDALGADLRRRIERHHSLTHWADEVVRLAGVAHADGRPAARPAPAP